MVRMTDYEAGEFSVFDLEDGDKLWRIADVFIEVNISGKRGDDDAGFSESMMFVASLNVGKKFKVYYSDGGWEPYRCALDGKKLPIGNKAIAHQLFPHLVAGGWEFIV